MSKRAAAVQLTADNADELEQTGEEAGKFETASQEEIQQRVIKKAKRGRGLDQSTSGGGAGGIFSAIFNTNQSLTSSSTSTSGGIKLGTANPLAGIKFGVMPTLAGVSLPVSTPLAIASSSSLTGLSSLTNLSSSSKSSAPIVAAAAAAALDEGHASKGSSEYLEQLKSLNRSVSQWISQHVQKNPHVDLTPIFKDYAQHLKNIDAKYRVGEQAKELSEKKEPAIGGRSSCLATSETNSNTGSSRGASVTTEEATPTSTDATPTPMNTINESAPPPSTVTPSSDDSLFSVRTKLFYKKDSEYVDLGVGTLKVQSSSSKGTVQLLMRNDTSLGTILLNVRVTASTPMSCNKKSVLLMCPVANPPLQVEGAVTYLLRVKTAELAEELLDTIKKNTAESV